MSVGGISAFFFGNPNPEVNAGPNGESNFQAGVVGTVEALCYEVGDEGYPTVVDFVGAVVNTGGGARAA